MTKRKRTTEKQRKARERNWVKGRIQGMANSLQTTIDNPKKYNITVEEIQVLMKAYLNLKSVLDDWKPTV